MASNTRYRLGSDIGGTFTDGVLLDGDTGELTIAKILTTPRDLADGAREAVAVILRDATIAAAEVFVMIHGTTLVANTLVQRAGAKTGLLTTAGFADVLEIGRELRYDVYNLTAPMPAPLVPWAWRKEVPERMLADGTVYVPVDLAVARAAVADLVCEGVEAVAVCFLHAYRNPAHERAVGDLIAREFPGLPYCLSSEVAAEFREYERMSTTVANAYVQPLMGRYLEDLERRLRADGYRGRLYVMLSSGGITTADTAAHFPVRLVESGPAAGALAAGYFGTLIGEERLISFDMGGTTAKTCLIDGGRPTRTKAFEVARVHRFMPGSGLPVRSPVIDMIEVGAGGGSIASLDELGLLKVGPRSAGADPGPACYGLGGEEPTVTDANLILGYLDPEFFAGGTMRLYPERAAQALEGLARAMEADVVGAAWGVHEVVSENMAAAVRIHLAEKGRDPRRYALFAFGGGGPTHAERVARKLRVPRIICPLGAGVLSAFGFLVAPAAFDFLRTYITRLDYLNWDDLNALYAEMEAEGRRVLGEAGVPEAEMRFVRSADMRYVGQMHEITVPVPAGALTEQNRPALEASFYQTYASLYGAHTTDPIEALTWRLLATGPDPQVALKVHSGRSAEAAGGRAEKAGAGAEKASDGAEKAGGGAEKPAVHADIAAGRGAHGGPAARAKRGRRPVYFPGAGYVDTAVYDRYQLATGFYGRGPAVVEERESTVLVYPGDRFRIDPYMNLIIELSDEEVMENRA
ncbi:MAG: hydantoinase/oxoprolinase family protein [Armatimonadetes bacterium]|nr:hydantoinase/oxoprolinase family protein [Armatimonadota bacterium]